MNITKEEAIRVLARYDNEFYTPATREAHRMGIEALNRVEELEKELAEERNRHDRYVDFELAEAEELRLAKEQLRSYGCDHCEHEALSADDYPCMECSNAGGQNSKWEWRKHD